VEKQIKHTGIIQAVRKHRHDHKGKGFGEGLVAFYATPNPFPKKIKPPVKV
jgi:hypothetical protein